jgi:ribonuclease P protein component
MIPRNMRVHPRQIAEKHPKTLRFPEGLVRVARVEGAGGIAIIVPKKTSKSSVMRHLIKRRFAAALVPQCIEGLGIVVSVGAGGAELRGAALRAWCTDLKTRILEATHA